MSKIGIQVKTLAFGSLLAPLLFASFSAQAGSAGNWKDGAQVYEKVCGQCHETNGDIGVILAGRQLPPAYIQLIVRNGLRAMPAFAASFIDDKALQNVSEYIQKMPAKGKE